MSTNKNPEEEILQFLPSNTSRYPYEGLQDFWSHIALEQENFHNDKTGKCSQYVLFTNVTDQAFTRDFDISKHKPSWRLFDSYYPYTQLLVIRMVTSKDHERAHTALANLLIGKLAAMNEVNLSLDWTGSADIETPSRTKRADQEFAPRNRPPDRSELWPTLVMEAGFSESKPKLESGADWWIKASQGDVRTALTISVHRKTPEIVIKKWEPICTLQTSNRAQFEPVLQKHLVVSNQKGQTEAVVINGPLVLSFRDLFLRDAGRGEKEEIEFSENDIRTMAQMVWKKQKF